MPSKSGVTRICPSQSGPEPMPMVGIGICCGQFFRDRGVTSSSTTANAPAVGQRVRVRQQRLAFRLSLAFDVVAAFLEHMLGQHAEMAQERNPAGDDRPHLLQNRRARLRPSRPRRRPQPAAAHWPPRPRRSRNCDRAGRPPATPRGLPRAPRAHVMLHLRHGDVGGIRITQHHHAQRIAHQDQRNARLIQQPRHRKIVGGQRGDFSPRPFMARMASAVSFGTHASPLRSGRAGLITR